MRSFELISSIFVFLSIISIYKSVERRLLWQLFLPVIASVFNLLQFLIEGYRWQMCINYLLPLILLTRVIKPIVARVQSGKSETTDRKTLRITGMILSLLIFLLAVPFLVLSPVFELPRPEGQYLIGSKFYAFQDQSRPETFTDDPNDKREIVMQIWYPSKPAKDQDVMPYRSTDVAHQISRYNTKFLALRMPLPSFLEDHFNLVNTHSYLNSPILTDTAKYPLLIYNHGILYGHFRNHVVLMEELASYGYIVVSIGHAFQTPYFQYPNGEVKSFDLNNETLQGTISDFYSRDRAESINQLNNLTDTLTIRSLIKNYLQSMPTWQKSIYTWSDDISSTIDELKKLEQIGDPLASQIDFTKIGVLGWSFGGAAALQSCLSDNRVTVGLSLDGSLLGDAFDKALDKPFMFIRRSGKSMLNDYVYNKSLNETYMLEVDGVKHGNFTDMGIYGKLWLLSGIIANTDGYRPLQIINKYACLFFDHYLKQKPLEISNFRSDHLAAYKNK